MEDQFESSNSTWWNGAHFAEHLRLVDVHVAHEVEVDDHLLS